MVTTSWEATQLATDIFKPRVRVERCQAPADRDLERRLIRFFHQQGLDGVQGLRIEADRGTVVVSGRIPSPDRGRCLACCQRVAGVVRVIDRLQSGEPV
jgi:hypothetical protein